MVDKHILFCFDVYYPNIGGGEFYYQKIAEAAVAAGNRATLVTTHTHADSPSHEFHNGVDIYRVKTPARILFALLALPLMWRLSRSADLIHTSTFAAAFPSYLVGKIRRKPTVISIHEIFGTLWFRFVSPLAALVTYYGEKLILALGFSAVLTPSRYSSNSVRLASRKIRDERLYTIYLGVDRTEWRTSEEKVTLGKKLLKDVDGKIVLFFGRPGVSKGLEYLIRAMTFVQDADAILVAITAHRDPRFPIMQRLVRELKLEKKVHFYDSLPRPDLIAAASAADVIVIPSVVEGFGFVAAESAVLGKPLVVSESGSLPEVVSGDVVFVRPSSPRSIASGIDRALTGATQHIPQKEFAWQDCIDATFAVYDQLLSHE